MENLFGAAKKFSGGRLASRDALRQAITDAMLLAVGKWCSSGQLMLAARDKFNIA